MGRVQQLDAAIKNLAALQVEVAVRWGDTVLAVIEVIRSETAALAMYGSMITGPQVTDELRKFLFVWPIESARTPSVVGNSYVKLLDKYTTLADDWLAQHLGRDGTKSMTVVELKEHRRRIDDEIERLVEPEEAALLKAREKMINENGGENAVARMFKKDPASRTSADATGGSEPGPKK
jgi:hypothetical protein